MNSSENMAHLITARWKKKEKDGRAEKAQHSGTRNGCYNPPTSILTLPHLVPEDASNPSQTLSHEPESGSRLLLSTAFQAAGTTQISVDTGDETRFLFLSCSTSRL